MRAALLALALAFVSTGCYHTTVLTGKPMGTTVVDKPFALGFIYGLIPPPDVNVAQECPQGVAKVETQQSVVNSLVTIITFGIVAPQQITVTCASGTASLDQPSVDVARGAEVEDVQTAFAEAADQAVESGGTVYVHFE